MPLVACGQFADVLALGDGGVVKAFRRIPPNVRPTADDTLIPRVLFAAERRAYEGLQAHPELEIYCSRYFGTIDPLALAPGAGYAAGCGLLLEEIRGSAAKVRQLQREDVEAVLERIRDATSADDVWDASCFVPGSRAPFTLIDFATPSDALDLLDRLFVEYGRVPDERRGELGL